MKRTTPELAHLSSISHHTGGRSRGLDGVIDLFKLDKFEKLSEIPLNTRVLELRDKVQDSHFEVYTDGSKVNGGVGFSVCILHGEIQHKIICKKIGTPEHCLPG
ncbi:hypothetical protein AVEN_171068-1 [Araneus ventricosus]|uniref:RNase H type-1 domain-containing protein n=1 Tax=Araneus ventricosus TaxID=182803 RepID=A0A4Y2QH55_ARAVE|nr:hypothetical protein AVEN_171068-1 [Araneus ventricosus]